MLELIKSFGSVINLSMVVVMSLGLLAFFWGLVRFIFRVGGDEKAVDEGKRTMKWGLTALFVMVAVWGIIRFIDENLLSVSGGVTNPFNHLPPGE